MIKTRPDVLSILVEYLLRTIFVFYFCVNVIDGTATAEEPVDFARDIQPILANHCVLCHGPDDSEAGLRLDIQESSTKKLKSGNKAVVPGKPEVSELINRVISTDDFIRMPPEGDPLKPKQIKLLQQWIKQGGEFTEHWAYQPIKNPPRPELKNSDWIRNPIDEFVLARLEKLKNQPSPEAPKATLIKRLYYDLIGLPPTPEEVDAFVSDQDPNAYESLVDRTLKSKHFGERWGRHWLDKARYADSDGYEKDRPRPNAWRYRDWVINAINDDMPFDQFTIEQLAGDLLPNADKNQLLATAFHRQTLTNTEGGTDKEQFRVEATFDRTETTAAIWMGLTMTCARCHSHKYDRISQTEYYQLYGFFNSSNESNYSFADDDAVFEQYQKDKADYQAQLTELKATLEQAKREIQPTVIEWEASQRKLIAESQPIKFHRIKIHSANSASGAPIVEQPDGTLSLNGEVPDQDKYTTIVKANELELTGLKLDVLAADSLPGKGPGRAPNGNFVLSEIKVELGDTKTFEKPTPIKFVSAQADFSQSKFPAEAVLSPKKGTGWAVAPKMGEAHQITLSTDKPIAIKDGQFLRITLDQSYGGSHVIGKFRLSMMTGSGPFNGLPKDVVDALKTAKDKQTPKHQQAIVDHVASVTPKTKTLADELAKLQKQAPKDPRIPVRVMTPANRKTRLLHRGDFLQPKDEVKLGILGVAKQTHPLTSRNEEQTPDRLDLARWLVHENHPLTPRVVVNHAWSQLFGEGIARTVNDFGVRGDRPTHPQLLDWLAYNFPRDMNWSRKELIRTIVTSATYRQSSNHRPELSSVDPTNQLLARQNRVRVEAEIVRDLYLANSGLISLQVGGPSVFPPLPPGVAELSYANSFKWKTSKGDNKYRRGMYTFFKRTAPHPNLIGFDCPDSNTTKLKRDASNTPLQALTTLNNPVFAEAAQAMAARVLKEKASDHERLDYALRLCIAREPSPREIEQFHGFLEKANAFYAANLSKANEVIRQHPAENVPVAENAAWVVTVRMILNLDEFIVRD